MKAYEDCPRFERCAVNKCPLDPAYKEMSSVPGDAEKKCTMPRKRRQEIGARFDNLAYGGLTGNEYTALQRVGKIPPNFANGENPTPISETPAVSGVRV